MAAGFTKQELETFKEKLLKKTEEPLKAFEQQMQETQEIPLNPRDPADQTSELLKQEIDLSLTETERELLEEIEHALKKIEEGTYGICESCGNPIKKSRLMARPEARRCTPCQEKYDREQRKKKLSQSIRRREIDF